MPQRESTVASHVSEVELKRQQYRRRQDLQSVVTSVISTIVLAVLAVTLLKMSPGWSRVQESFFSAKYFVSSFPEVLKGLWLNVEVLFFAVIGVGILGTLLAVMRISRSPILFPLRALAQIQVASTYNFTPYVVASVLFIIMSVPFILLNDWYSARLRARELSGGTV